MKSAPTLTLLALLGASTLSSAAVMQRLPYNDKVPVNLANRSIPGTRLERSEGINDAGALISGGGSDAAVLMDGKAEATIALVGTHSINEVYFANDGAEGKVSIFASTDNKAWQGVAQAPFAEGQRTVSVRFGNAQARFVKVSFEVAKSAGIRSFGIYGATSDKDYKMTPSAEASPVNLAGGVGGSRPIYAYPTPVNTDATEIKKNIFRFPKSTDRYRILVYDLGTPRQIRQLAVSYSERPTRVEAFTFTTLPEKQDWRNKTTLDTAIFDQTAPAAAEVDARGAGHITLKPAKPIVAQYVAFRFEPNYSRREGHASLNEGWAMDVVMDFSPAVKALSDALGFGQSHAVLFNEDDGGFTIGGLSIFGGPVGGGGLIFFPIFNPNGGPTGNGNPNNTFNTTDGWFPNSNFNNFFADHAASGIGNSLNPFAIPHSTTPFTIPPLIIPPIHFPTPPTVTVTVPAGSNP